MQIVQAEKSDSSRGQDSDQAHLTGTCQQESGVRPLGQAQHIHCA